MEKDCACRRGRQRKARHLNKITAEEILRISVGANSDTVQGSNVVPTPCNVPVPGDATVQRWSGMDEAVDQRQTMSVQSQPLRRQCMHFNQRVSR